MRKHFLKKVRVIILVILLVVCNSEFGLCQLYPEPELGYMAGQAIFPVESKENGLLFYLSGEKKFQADFAAGGQKNPNYLHGIKIISDGAIGSAFEASDDQLISYWAPGNIFAQRGTISFFWRSRYPVGPTPFPIFRVGFADHTSWDMVWLRIDYNGAGFDAFVTDVGLARTRVSYYTENFPAPNKWTHLAFSWDETEGVRLYVNGELVKKQSRVGKVFDAGLDQFGFHSRIISPYQVQSAYNFMRGGDFDELNIYDRMLSDENIKELFQGKTPVLIPELNRNLNERKWLDEWRERNGWNLPNEPPPLLPSKNVTVKKTGIYDAFDVKRWTWKASDGIRETTWPGVFNMSRLPGRYDYFVLPDWDCYSISGQSLKIQIPNEPWNHVEIWGTAFGQLTVEKENEYDYTFSVKGKEQIKSYHQLKEPVIGGEIRFDNALIEEPIGEIGIYHVHEGKAPENRMEETFTIHPANGDLHNKTLLDISSFIDGRYPLDERIKMVGIKRNQIPDDLQISDKTSLPVIHILIPYSENKNRGLYGVEVELPPLHVTGTNHGIYPMNIRIKDPLWAMRDLADFSFSVKPDTPYTLWMDTRDLILPENRALYITLSGADYGLSANALKNMRITLVYKSEKDASPEHELERFTQVRDLYSHIVEEHPSSPRLNLYNRFYADLSDLLKVNPYHWLGKAYQYAASGNKADRPDYKIPECPGGVPGWAFLQTEYLRQVEKIISYYIDNRQISNGEFGGGLSDDDDFTNRFVGSAFMGIETEKIKRSLQLLIEGYYNQDRDSYNAPLRQRSLPLFTNGLSTIKADELHSYEEGIEAVGQLMMIDYGNPLYFNRGMEIARRLLNDITGIDPDGHRHFRSRYYSGTDISTEDPWQWSQNSSYLVLQAAYLVARYNGNPLLRKMIIELADGLLAHRDKNGNLYTEINFSTGDTRGQTGAGRAWTVFRAAFEFSGDSSYLSVIPDKTKISMEFNPEFLENYYKELIIEKGVRQYIETEGSIWIDRINRDDPIVQQHRLGGVALIRVNNILPQNHVSWNFQKPNNFTDMAFFVTEAKSENFKIIAYNLENNPVNSKMELWNIKPGQWRITQGVDTNNDQIIDFNKTERIVYLQNSDEVEFSFPSRKNTIINLDFLEPAAMDYWERPDLAVCSSEINFENEKITLRLYNIGAVRSPESALTIKNEKGEIIATSKIPSIEPPLDLIPSWKMIVVNLPVDTDLKSGSLEVNADNSFDEITRRNNVFTW